MKTSSTSTVYEVTPDDVRKVLADAKHPVNLEQAEAIYAEHIASEAGEGGRIERAALYAQNLPAEIAFAHEEIAAILRAKGALPPAY